MSEDKIIKDALEKIIMKTKVDKNKLLKVLPQLSILDGCSQNHPAHCYGVLEHTIKVVENVPKDLIIRITALFHDIGKPNCKALGDDGFEHFWGHEEKGAEITKVILESLGYENEFIEKIITIIKYHDTKIEPNIEGIENMINKIGEDNFKLLIIHQKADLIAHSKEYYNKKINILNKINNIYKRLNNKKNFNFYP